MKKSLLWRAMFLAASLSSVMSVGASPFEEEAQEKQTALSIRAQMSVTKEVNKRKRASLARDKIKQARTTLSRETSSHLKLTDEQDNPSLGNLDKLPSEVLGNIFSYDNNPLRLRCVSTAFKSIVDTYLPVRLQISTLEGTIPDFIQNRRVSLEGWVCDLKALKERFPVGTIFRGGHLTCYDSAVLLELPPLATATLMMTEAPKTEEEKKRFEKNLPEGVEIKWLQTLWAEYVHSPLMSRLDPSSLDTFNRKQKNLEFLLGFENGQKYLDVLVQRGIYSTLLPNFQLRIEIVDPLAGYGEGVEAQGRVAAILNALDFELLTRFTAFEEFRSFLYRFLCLPDQVARLKVASALRPEMLLYDPLFFRGAATYASGFDYLLTFLNDDPSGQKAALMTRLDLRKVYAVDSYGVVFSILHVLSKRQSVEEAVSLSTLMTKNLVSAFVVQANNGVRRLNVEDFSKVIETLATMPSQNKQKQLLNASRERGKISKTALMNFIDLMTKSKSFETLLKKVNLNKISKACLKDTVATTYVLYALANLEERDALHLSKLITQDFLFAFDTKDPLGIKKNYVKTLSLRSALSGHALKDAMRALAALPAKKRQAVISLMSSDLLVRSCEQEEPTLRGDHAVNTNADLLDDLRKEKELESAHSLLTPSFVRLFLKGRGYDRESLKEALHLLMEMDNAPARTKAMEVVSKKFHHQLPTISTVMEFLRQVLRNDNHMQIEMVY